MSSKESRKIDIFGAITVIVVSLVTFFVRDNVMNGSEISNFSIYLGIGLFIIGFIYTIMEKKMNLPYFYGKCQSGGSNANSFVVIGIGIGLMGKSISTEIIILMGLLSAVLLTRNLMERKYLEKENK